MIPLTTRLDERGTGPLERSIGPFRLEGELGRGGVGVVHRARHERTGRPVALKVLASEGRPEPRALVRFLGEARALAALRHRGIVSIVTRGATRDAAYLALELIDGDDLDAVLRRLRCAREVPAAATPMPGHPPGDWFDAAARVVLEVADALQHAHSRRVIHRDVKPSNVMIDADGHARLVDFGLARVGGDPGITRDGDVVGTPFYLSPEQALGLRSVDVRTDVYGLGAVLYELLTFRRPFEGRTAEDVVAQARVGRAFPVRRRNPAVPRRLAAITTRAMHRDPSRRYATAAAMRDDLGRFLRSSSAPTPWSRRLRRLCSIPARILANRPRRRRSTP